MGLPMIRRNHCTTIYRLGALASIALLAACDSSSGRSTDSTSWPDRPPAELKISDRKIEALIQCYKIILLTQDRLSGSGAKHDGVAATLGPARQMIEDRLVGDLTVGAEKMRINERVEADLQQLLRDKPYGSADLLLGGARYCAGLEQKNAWRDMRP